MPIVVAQELSGSHALPEAYYVYSHSQNHLAESQENCSGIGAGSSARSPAKRREQSTEHSEKMSITFK